ncbi:MAG TPA: GIY-YIG nuclease family protein [Erysipelothrix sp.]|jgi:putative endonuclease|nr:GIY-YIG nuclease family protein [Erysipelothrix sp.]
MYIVYILKCSDDTLYTGYTTNLDNRVLIHNKGLGAKYTKSRLPVTVVYHENFETKSEALKREYQIKQLTRLKKLQLINSSIKT